MVVVSDWYVSEPLLASSPPLSSSPAQKFTIAPDPMGITRVGDLSAEDMKKVRRLAFIELTSTFDHHGLALRMPKAEKVKSVKGEPTQWRLETCYLYSHAGGAMM